MEMLSQTKVSITSTKKNIRKSPGLYKKIPNSVIKMSGQEGYELLLQIYTYLTMASNMREEVNCNLELMTRCCEVTTKERSIKYGDYSQTLLQMTRDIEKNGKVILSQLVSVDKMFSDSDYDEDEITKQEPLTVYMELSQNQITQDYTKLELDEYKALQRMCVAHKEKSRKSLCMTTLLNLYMFMKMTIQRYNLLEPDSEYQRFSRQYIQDWVGISAGTVSAYLKFLEDNGFLEINREMGIEVPNEYRLSEKWREMK